MFAPAPFSFVGPVVQSARLGGPETCQNWSKSFWRHSPVLVLDACRKRVKVGFRGSSSTLDDFQFVASLLCMAGAALSSILVKFCGRRRILELFVQISWQAQYLGAWVSMSWQARQFDSARSLGWVKSLSLRRGAHFERAK